MIGFSHDIEYNELYTIGDPFLEENRGRRASLDAVDFYARVPGNFLAKENRKLGNDRDRYHIPHLWMDLLGRPSSSQVYEPHKPLPWDFSKEDLYGGIDPKRYFEVANLIYVQTLELARLEKQRFLPLSKVWSTGYQRYKNDRYNEMKVSSSLESKFINFSLPNDLPEGSLKEIDLKMIGDSGNNTEAEQTPHGSLSDAEERTSDDSGYMPEEAFREKGSYVNEEDGITLSQQITEDISKSKAEKLSGQLRQLNSDETEHIHNPKIPIPLKPEQDSSSDLSLNENFSNLSAIAKRGCDKKHSRSNQWLPTVEYLFGQKPIPRMSKMLFEDNCDSTMNHDDDFAREKGRQLLEFINGTNKEHEEEKSLFVDLPQLEKH